MIDLSSICGLPIQLNEETGEITVEGDSNFEKEIEVALNEIIPVLLNKFLRYPEKVYKMHSKVFRSQGASDLEYSLIQIPYGLLGIEFIKTHIFYSDFDSEKVSSFVEVVSGEITLIIQRNKESQDEYAYTREVDNVDIIKLSKGDRIAIPAGVYFTFVNTGSQQCLIAVVTSSKVRKVDYSNFQRERGLAYFIISKNARLEIVANPRYKVACKACQTPFKKLKQKYTHDLIKEKQPLYSMLSSRLEELVNVFV